MWSAYSKPGGVAVRIKFTDFKRQCLDYFGKSKENGIANIHGGLIKCIDHDADFETWQQQIDAGIPLAFFKQHHFAEEREYRLLIERDANITEQNFKSLHPVFDQFDKYDLVLHPSSSQDDYMALKSRLSNHNRRINFSRLSFNKK